MPYLENTVSHGSVLTVLAISIERYRVVCRPLRGVNDSLKKVGKNVTIIWIVSAAASVPSLFIAVFKDSYYMDGTPVKVCRNYVHLDWHKAYIIMLTCLFFIFPCALLFCLYCKVCYVLRTARRGNIPLGQTNRYRDRKKLKKQVMNLLISIVLLFFICHLPFRVLGIWIVFENEAKLASLGLETYFNILYSCRIMFYLNHAVNPIIYNFASTKFRSALMYMCTCRTRYSFHIARKHKRQENEVNHCIWHRQKQDRGSRNGINNHDKEVVEQLKRNEFFPMYAHIIQGSFEQL